MRRGAASFAAFGLLWCLLSGESHAAEYDPPRLINPDPDYLCAQNPEARIKSKPKLLERCLPGVPEECFAAMKFRTTVKFLVDIESEGIPNNIRVVASTNECFNHEFANAVSKSVFHTNEKALTDILVRVQIIKHSDQIDQKQTFEGLRNY